LRGSDSCTTHRNLHQSHSHAITITYNLLCMPPLQGEVLRGSDTSCTTHRNLHQSHSHAITTTYNVPSAASQIFLQPRNMQCRKMCSEKFLHTHVAPTRTFFSNLHTPAHAQVLQAAEACLCTCTRNMAESLAALLSPSASSVLLCNSAVDATKRASSSNARPRSHDWQLTHSFITVQTGLCVCVFVRFTGCKHVTTDFL